MEKKNKFSSFKCGAAGSVCVGKKEKRRDLFYRLVSIKIHPSRQWQSREA
jgi:hypothetical protein